MANDELLQIFDYEDILLQPRKCVVKSRSECNTTVKLGKHQFRLPVVPANMKAVINEDICTMLARGGYFYIMHRFGENDKFIQFAKRMRAEKLLVSLSIGVKEKDRQLVRELASSGIGADFLTIDIAHGHAESVREMIAFVRQQIKDVFIIAGNVGSPEGVKDLEAWGADCTKIGIGPGKVCITRLQTGFGTGGWQLSAVKHCCSVATKPVIADGGIKHIGDIAKSFRFGATMVMCGSLFAGHQESPGEVVKDGDGNLCKEYFGSASEYNKGEKKHVEGKQILEPLKGNLSSTLQAIEEALQSSISYAGGTKITDLRRCNYVVLGGMNKKSHMFGTTD